MRKVPLLLRLRLALFRQEGYAFDEKVTRAKDSYVVRGKDPHGRTAVYYFWASPGGRYMGEGLKLDGEWATDRAFILTTLSDEPLDPHVVLATKWPSERAWGLVKDVDASPDEKRGLQRLMSDIIVDEGSTSEDVADQAEFLRKYYRRELGVEVSNQDIASYIEGDEG
jgi:hypothetical protein